MSKLSPVPYRIPMLDQNGRITRSWQQWFQSLLGRVGGTGDIATNSELQGENELSLGAQTSSHLAEILRRLDDAASIPAGVHIPAEDFDLSPAFVSVAAESLGLDPRSEVVAPDFTLGTMPGGSL